MACFAPQYARLQGDAAVGQRGTDLHDGAPVAGFHLPQGGHGAVDVAEVADLGDPAVFVRVDLLERREHRGERHVHPHVDGSEFVLDAVGGGENLRLVGHIGRDQQGAAAAGADIPGGAGQSFLAAGQQRDAGAAGAERGGDRAADAAAGPGDHHDLCSH